MHNITLIATTHSEMGKCNAHELYKIIEEIKPEIIFDELPRENFETLYNESYQARLVNNVLFNQKFIATPIEVQCNIRYKQNYDVDIIPVDIDTSHELSIFKDDIDRMFMAFFKNEEYLKLDAEKEILILQEGFYFLNSAKFLDFQDKKEALEKTLIELDIERDKFTSIYNELYSKQYHNREYAMLNNIYNFSKSNHYNKAVFLIGADHKKSFVQKIAAYEKQTEMHLNWTMFGDK